ncbi:EF-hand domain-containing protein [Phenylobacterium sp.]|uniref:EF-hand domain-containing protein n=1 Tax=Phenylobacterium sp. TaxID=1871053 RepID=UPI002DF4A592|nr:EF-hand domain-containing protein [Phenylobacterium sp.]
MRTLILAASAAAMLAVATTASAQAPAPADIIKAWDKDGDGTVDKAEWIAAGRPAERFDLVDLNHDGKITVEELTAAMAAMRQRQGGAPPAPPAPAPALPPGGPR